MKLLDALAEIFAETQSATDRLKQAGKLAPGQRARVRFTSGTHLECSDRDYIVSVSGAWHRAEPKPWSSKAEMKAHKRARRAERMAA